MTSCAVREYISVFTGTRSWYKKRLMGINQQKKVVLYKYYGMIIISCRGGRDESYREYKG